MITLIKIPLAFENMEEATIGEWQVKVGETVHKGQPLCALITEKTTFDLPSPVDGILRLIVLPVKSVAAVGEVICLIGELDDELPDIATLANSSAVAPEDTKTGIPVPKSTFPRRKDRIRATPAARRAARESGVSLEEIAAAFPDKVLLEDDVRNFKENG